MAQAKRACRMKAAVLIAAAALAGLSLAACGGSTKDTSASAGTTGTSTNAATPPGGAERFAALRTCLQREGIKLPRRPAGQHGRPSGSPSRGGFFPGGGSGGLAGRLPKGVTAQELQAALKKCGGGLGPARGHFFDRVGARKALTEFAACMSQDGVKLPPPNTSGHGPIFDTKGIDTSGTRFRNAETKCAGKLPGPFARAGGIGGAPPGGA